MTEAARALRAIFLNIVGDTKTEIDEGVTWTTGEIAGLRDVIKLYAKDAYDAAQASGEVIDPMRAIAGLAQSVKDGVLSEAKLTEMVSDIGGKLRTSQLLAIVNNWDMYEQMLQTYRNAYGSADKEIDNAMDSWTRKTNVLKNTWTEFVKKTFDSKVFKFGIDALTRIIERLGTLHGFITRLIPLFAALKLREMARDMNGAAKAATDMAEGMKAASTAATTLNWIAAVLAAISIAWNAVSMAQEDAKIKHQESVDRIYEEAEAAKSSVTEIMTLYGGMMSAASGTDEFNKSAQQLAETLGTDLPSAADEAIEKLRQLTEAELESLSGKLFSQKTTAEDEFVRISGESANYKILSGVTRGEQTKENEVAYVALINSINGIYSELRALNGEENGWIDLSTLENAKRYRDAVAEIVQKIELYAEKTKDRSVVESDYYEELQGYLRNTEESYGKLNSAVYEYMKAQGAKQIAADLKTVSVDTKEAFDGYIQSIQSSNEYSTEYKEMLVALAKEYFPQYAEQIDNATESTDDHTEAVKKETDALDANQRALEKNATASEKAAAAKKDAEAAVRKFIPALFDENNELTATAVSALTASNYLADLTQAELNARLEAAKANYAALRAQLAAVAADALKAAYALSAVEGIVENAGSRHSAQMELMAQLHSLKYEIDSLTVQSAAVAPYTSTYKPSGSSGSSGGGSGGSGGGRSSSSSASTEDKKLTALKDRVALLKSELSLMKERGDSEEDQIAKIREIQEALRKEYEYLESIKGDQTTINNLYQEWYSYANQISDLEGKAADEAQKHADAIQAAVDAQKALDNILKNRSVRVYNASTGQWEWQADPAAVASAQSDLNNAISSAGYTQDAWALLYSALSGIASIKDNWLNSGPGAVSNAFGGNSYGNTYNFGSIRLSEAQAQSMTVAEFARLANALPAFNNSP